MLRDLTEHFGDYSYTGTATIQLFDEGGNCVKEVVKKNAINTKMANYYYSRMKWFCIRTYRDNSSSGNSVAGWAWEYLRITHSKYLDSLQPHELQAYKTLSYAHMWSPHSGAETNRGTINRKETSYNIYSGLMSRRDVTPYINFVCDFPTHVANTTFDSVVITGSNPSAEEWSQDSLFYYYSNNVDCAPIIHDDESYSIDLNKLVINGAKYNTRNTLRQVELFPSDNNKNGYVSECFYNNRLYIFSNNVSTGQLDLLEVLNYKSATPTVKVLKSNLETDGAYPYVADVVIRDGKIFIMRGKNATKEHRVVVIGLTSFAKIHSHDFTTTGNNKYYSARNNRVKCVGFNTRNRIVFYINTNENNYKLCHRVDILLSDYSHVDWETTYDLGYNLPDNGGISAVRFSNLFLIKLTPHDYTGDVINGKYMGRANPANFSGVSHIVKLDSPITKTESNTMKIQYRVEFENTAEPTLIYADELGNTWS